MDFVLWVCRVMHVVSVVLWLGGLIFLNAVLNPVVEQQKAAESNLVLALQKRFLPFIWFSVWTMFVTGILLTLLSPRFLWLDYSTTWSKLLAVKQVSFLLMVFFSWQTAKVFANMERSAGGETQQFEGWRLAFSKLVKRTIFFGLLTLLCAGGMSVV